MDDYQVYEARAFGADAILLMANVLDAQTMQRLHHLALELGMEALFEIHTTEEIATLPAGARVVGINSRKFKTNSGFVAAGQSSATDFSLDLGVFDLVSKLPASAIRVAESGISPQNLSSVASNFQAALVGTSLLRDERGIRACLHDFEVARPS